MLRHLHIEDYALIDRLDMELHAGLNLLTGETGSGKSIVVEAVGLLLGDKASPELIRSGAERARIVGVFAPTSEDSESSVSSESSTRRQRGRWRQLLAILEGSGIEAPPGEDLILQRDIQGGESGGRSRLFVNNQPATVTLLKSIAPLLGEVHGQNEQQELFQASTQLEALDRFGDLAELADAVRERFERWRELRKQLESLSQQKQEWQRQMDLWRFQQREIEQASVVAGEDERLEEEKQILVHAERIQSRLASCYDLLYDSQQSAVAALASAQRQLEEVSALDGAVKAQAESLQSARAAIEDAAFAVRDRLARLEASPARLEEVENRLALLDRLKRKYGATLEEVIRQGEQVSRQIAEAEAGEATTQALEEQVRAAAKEYEKGAGELSARRKKAAKDLKRAVESELAGLAMAGTKFEASLTASAEEDLWRSTGWDRIEFLISPNPGEPLRTLARIASGGETSRIMLALETVIATRPSGGARSGEHTLIFDEVDAGIGGRAAETVGKKLRQLGESRQVLCVTHLPQIASFAHHHFRVEKIEQGGRTVTRVEYLKGAARKEELARMLSGSQITPAVLQHAAQLLKANTE